MRYDILQDIMERGITEEELIDLGILEKSNDPFLMEVIDALGNLDERLNQRVKGQKELRVNNFKLELGRVSKHLGWTNRHRGFGYMSSSYLNNRSDEILASALVVRSIKENSLNSKPILIPVDRFYSYYPSTLSLVDKTQIFNNWVSNRDKFTLILTNFSSSQLYTDQVITQIPNQDEIGLSVSGGFNQIDSFAQKLDRPARSFISDLMSKEKTISRALEKLSADEDPENVRLFLATVFLLSDKQAWQNLWYENQKQGTPLYIVAPALFHHSMNRLNLSWGHGGCDYQYRASCSLGALDEPLFERSIHVPGYSEIGLSNKEFRVKVEGLIQKL